MYIYNFAFPRVITSVLLLCAPSAILNMRKYVIKMQSMQIILSSAYIVSNLLCYQTLFTKHLISNGF